MRKTVVNEYGVNVDYDLAVSMMDDDLREDAQKAKESGLLTDDFINILKSKYRNL